jgi:hypothetical protein
MTFGSMRIGILVLLVSVCLAAPVHAQAEATDANALIDRGVERRRAGDDEGALALFTRAFEAGHSPRARAQMALVEQALGHFVDAEAHLIEALAARDDEWIARRRADLQLALEAIELRLGYLEVRGGIEGADVRVDGRSIGTLPIESPVRLAAGSYRMEVIARQHYPFARTITIVPEGTTRETVVLSRTPGPPGSEADADGETRPRSGGVNTRSVLGGSLLGAGGAMLVVSVATFAVRQGRANDFNSDACLVGSATRGETCGALYDDTMRAQRASIATLSLGAALAVAGSLLFVIGGDDGNGDDDSAESAAAAELSCGVSVGADWGGRCRLRF